MAVPDSPPAVQPSLYLAKCMLRSSAVLQAVYGHIRSPTTLDIVFGKETALELAVVSEDGVVQSVCEQPVFGSIKDLRILPWNESFRGSQPELFGKDLLVLVSDSGKLSFLTFSMDLHRFLAVAHTHLAPTGNAAKDLGSVLAIEPRGRAVAVAAFEDRVAVFPTSVAAGNNVVEKGMVFPGSARSSVVEPGATGLGVMRGGWGTIWSMAFVECTKELMTTREEALILVVLLQRSEIKACEILVLKCDTWERTIHVLAAYDPAAALPGYLALNLIEFPVLPGYLLLSRAGDLLLLDLRIPSSPRASPIVSGQQESFSEKPRSVDDGEGPDKMAASALLELFSRGGHAPEKSSICAWSWQPDCGDQPKLVLGMDTGEIAIAQVSILNSEVFQIEIHESLYRCSPCRSLLWANGGFIAALIEMGDGQILELVDGALAFRSLIQNICPIFDFALVDYHEEKQDQMFACCGAGQEGSIRVIRSGTSVERLHSTAPVYQGVTGIWTLRLFYREDYHSFFVMSFVEETRVLSVGLNFVDISEYVGFECSASTLTCGLIEDGWIAQVCSKEILLCAPNGGAHSAGVMSPAPLRVSWKPQGAYISLGAVSKGKIILALSRPGVLMVLGTKMVSPNMYEVVEIQKCQLEAEVSCISIPCDEEHFSVPGSPSAVGSEEDSRSGLQRCGVEIGRVCVVGTHKPSVELLSIGREEGIKPIAVGLLSLVNSLGTVMGGCVPENVRLALFDRLYILCGLRNGMLLRYEWPSKSWTIPPSSNISLNPVEASTPAFPDSSFKFMDMGDKQQSMHMDVSYERTGDGGEPSRPVDLHLVDVRRIGISPVSFIPLQASLRTNVIALSDRPWLLQTSRNSQRLAYRSISFQPSTHGTPVRSPECPNGVLFVADCSLHLVEMEHSKRLNVQRLPLSRSPRHVLYHAATKMLLVMRSDNQVSDVCCVDPLTGTLRNVPFQLNEGEIGRCMHLWEQGGEQLLLVGTGVADGKAIMPNGEPECSKGRLLIFRVEPKFSFGKNKAGPSSAEGVSGGGILPTAGDNDFSQSPGYRPVGSGEFTTSEDGQDDYMVADAREWELNLISQTSLSSLFGMVLAVTPYLEQYILASAGNTLFCLKFLSVDSTQRLKKVANIKTRFVITSIAVHLNRIAVGDCRDGILFYSFREDTRKFVQLQSDPVQRHVADYVLSDLDTAVVTDRVGNFCVLSSAGGPEENVSPERNLTTSCWYHMGETIMRIQKGSFAYRAPVEENLKGINVGSVSKDVLDASLVASTLLGSVFIFIQVTREEYDLLHALQIRLASHSLTAPLLGNNHAQYRHRGCPDGATQVLDGDMLGQFLDLTNLQQQMVLAGENSDIDSWSHPDDPIQFGVLRALGKNLPLEQVLGLFEKIQNFLT